MSSRLQTIIRIVVILLALGLAAFALRGVDLRRAVDIAFRADIFLLAITLLVILIGLAIRVARWKYVLRPAGKVPIWDVASPLLISFFVGNVTITGAGAVPRVYVLNRKTGIDAGFAAGTIAQEFFLDATLLVLWSAIVPFFVDLPPIFRAVQALLFLALILLLLIDLAMVRHKVLSIALLKRFGLWARATGLLPELIRENLEGFGDGAGGVFFSLRLSSIVGILTILVWVTDVLMFWLLMRSIAIPFTLLQASAVMSYTNTAISVFVVPAFVGTLEVSAIGLMLAISAGQANAFAFTVLLRVFLVVPSTLIGAIFAAREGFRLLK